MILIDFLLWIVFGWIIGLAHVHWQMVKCIRQGENRPPTGYSINAKYGKSFTTSGVNARLECKVNFVLLNNTNNILEILNSA